MHFCLGRASKILDTFSVFFSGHVFADFVVSQKSSLLPEVYVDSEMKENFSKKFILNDPKKCFSKTNFKS
jgi:hypothetical protein